jgi:putative transposase
MPRANRYFLPGYVWHITHRCHKKEFLLKFAKDRRRWRVWLFEAKKRYGLCVLNYVATSNHIHLLVRDRGRGEIAPSMQLIAGRIAQDYNRRKTRNGAFWEDRYHATAVDTGDYLARCMTYIDLNMVRAGVVTHPAGWETGGYREIQAPPQRYAVIDRAALRELLGFQTQEQLQGACREWVDAALRTDAGRREGLWTEALAVGRPGFVESVKQALGSRAQYRETSEVEGMHLLREPAVAYTLDTRPEKAALGDEKPRFLD